MFMRKLWTGISVLVLLSVVVAGCAGTPQPAEPEEAVPTSEPAEMEEPTEAEEAPEVARQVRIVAEAVPPTAALEEIAPQFTDDTGVDVVIESYPFEDLMTKVQLDLQTEQGLYDLVSLPYSELGRLVENDQLLPLSFCLDDTDLQSSGFDQDDILPGLWQAASYYQGEPYGVPSNAAVMFMWYRQDLFENSAEQDAFEEEYGYPLAIPESWDQYRDTAEFFTRSAGQTLAGETLDSDFYGVVLAGKRHKAMVEEYLNYLWSFGGNVLDTNGNVVINSPEAVDATEFFLSLFAYAPPGATDYTWDEVTVAFQQEQVALGLQWNDQTFAVEDPDQSQVAGKMGFSAPPVKEEAAASFGGWTWVIPATSTNPEDACMMMTWISSPEAEEQLVAAGAIPSLASTYELPDVASDPAMIATGDALAVANSLTKVAEFSEMSDAIALNISQAIIGEVSSDEAIQALDEDLREIFGQ